MCGMSVATTGALVSKRRSGTIGLGSPALLSVGSHTNLRGSEASLHDTVMNSALTSVIKSVQQSETYMSAPHVHGQQRLHIGATYYDPANEEDIYYVGLNALPPTPLYWDEMNVEAHICWCAEGVFLNVNGVPWEVTSIRQKSQPLCINSRRSDQCMLENWNKAKTKHDTSLNKYTLMLARLPNAPFLLEVTSMQVKETTSEKTMSAQVHFMVGQLGRLVPAWICLKAPMQVFVGDLSLGCIGKISSSFDSVEVNTKRQEIQPTDVTVELAGSNGTSQVFHLPNTPVNMTTDLGLELEAYLGGGDAEIVTCAGKR